MKKTTFTILAFSILASKNIMAQNDEYETQTKIAYPTSFGISKALSELAEEQAFDENIGNRDLKEAADGEYRKPIKFLHTAEDGPEYTNDVESFQKSMGTRAAAPPLTDWAGQSGNSYPPDPSGAVGPNHYVQAVNATPVKIYNKTTGATVLQISSLKTLWTTPNEGSGDPIVLYDKYADRWFLAEFSTPISQGGTQEKSIYIAISKTSNPAGQYYTWTFTANSFPDYLKFSIWHDGYYMTSNENPDNIYVFERSAMITGSPTARMASRALITTGVSGFGSAFFAPLPADADGGLPTTGPCPLVYPVDNGWGASSDGVFLKEMTTTWGTSPSLSITTGSLIPTSAHDMSYDTGLKDVPQPGTTARLDGIGGVATYRAQWRKWTGYNTLLVAFGVKISANQRCSKWVELRQTGGVWSKYQEGVYGTFDTKSRWIPSIAMNDYGNIGLSYVRSSASAGDYPSCAYTGRLKTDPLGQMTIAETIVPGGTGTSSQIVSDGNGGYLPRFGDYGHTSLDPTDGCTFWSTMEYYSGAPKTRIWSYRIGNCTVGLDETVPEALSEYNVYQSDNLINIEASKLITDKPTQIDLFDINGREISSNVVNPISNTIKTTVNLTGLASGTYFVRLGNLEFQKVIKVFIK